MTNLFASTSSKSNSASIQTNLTRGPLISPSAEKNSGNGQTEAAHTLCRSIPADKRKHLLAKGVGHYGIFSGRKFRELIYPQIRGFIRLIAQRDEDLKLVRVK